MEYRTLALLSRLASERSSRPSSHRRPTSTHQREVSRERARSVGQGGRPPRQSTAGQSSRSSFSSREYLTVSSQARSRARSNSYGGRPSSARRPSSQGAARRERESSRDSPRDVEVKPGVSLTKYHGTIVSTRSEAQKQAYPDRINLVHIDAFRPLSVLLFNRLRQVAQALRGRGAERDRAGDTGTEGWIIQTLPQAWADTLRHIAASALPWKPSRLVQGRSCRVMSVFTEASGMAPPTILMSRTAQLMVQCAEDDVSLSPKVLDTLNRLLSPQSISSTPDIPLACTYATPALMVGPPMLLQKTVTVPYKAYLSTLREMEAERDNPNHDSDSEGETETPSHSVPSSCIQTPIFDRKCMTEEERDSHRERDRDRVAALLKMIKSMTVWCNWGKAGLALPEPSSLHAWLNTCIYLPGSITVLMNLVTLASEAVSLALEGTCSALLRLMKDADLTPCPQAVADVYPRLDRDIISYSGSCVLIAQTLCSQALVLVERLKPLLPNFLPMVPGLETMSPVQFVMNTSMRIGVVGTAISAYGGVVRSSTLANVLGPQIVGLARALVPADAYPKWDSGSSMLLASLDGYTAYDALTKGAQ
ncbi:hypothetical protein KIPB_009287 [Kipferlia bialata]|uniref:Uncharacterized protein n=1 Tax=Kipferlia bialata TaxID=797122 RepID=A0A9K3GLE8_9EUKA|nr:hypothetical protein KIPB_009287 [Kipferlia bialata]|eukprot:g9287.t1